MSINCLELVNSNSDRVCAIQDMLKIFVGKIKTSKKENTEFEEKIIKLLDELCNKLSLVKS